MSRATVVKPISVPSASYTAETVTATSSTAAAPTTAVCLMAGVPGLGAAAVVGPQAITADCRSGHTPVLLLAEDLRGYPLFSFRLLQRRQGRGAGPAKACW